MNKLTRSPVFPAADDVVAGPSAVVGRGERIRHTRIRAIIEDVNLMLDAGRNSSLLLVCGPTGVGKSTLGEYLVEAELITQIAAMAADAGFVPAIRVEAPASGEKEFSWRLFYERILVALEGELDAPRTFYGVHPETGRVTQSESINKHKLSDLRTAVERSLRSRRTRFIVVDEAVHMVNQCHPKRLRAQLDTLKSLSNEFGLVWVMLGSYDLFELLSLSGQLARRTHVLHFSRYREDSELDIQAFRTCLAKFGEWLPALSSVDLLAYADVFHRNTVGCIGTLRVVLERLAVMVAARGWSHDLLYAALLSDAQVEQILREVTDGEERIAPGLMHSRFDPKQSAHKRRA